MLIARKYPFYDIIEVKESTYLDIKQRLEAKNEVNKRLMTDFETNKEIIVFGSTAFRVESSDNN